MSPNTIFLFLYVSLSPYVDTVGAKNESNNKILNSVHCFITTLHNSVFFLRFSDYLIRQKSLPFIFMWNTKYTTNPIKTPEARIVMGQVRK